MNNIKIEIPTPEYLYLEVYVCRSNAGSMEKPLIAVSFHFNIAAAKGFLYSRNSATDRDSNTEKVGEIRAIYVNFSLFMYSGIL